MIEADANGSIEISAPAELVYRIVSDVPNLPQWAAECSRCEWKDGATGPAVGAKFAGYNRNRMFRWSSVATVVSAEPGRAFAFDVVLPLGSLKVSRWEYRIEETRDGCTVTESTWDRRGLFLKVASPLGTAVVKRREHNTKNIAATLQMLKAHAEQLSGADSRC